ncbi:MFS family permease [Chryseobacterium sp. H1D6B]|uniref:hypothetical protein n=1 Tax=Chryseobacterium sp. H1D6B TaxID=2940588 RepID=UPI0015C6E0D5|nr:hypothetical protein [Chryseobacterium sp. H1D6B]MDH6250970.1 MFS family permease [Chryseobacterium sp. H1D6B]
MGKLIIFAPIIFTALILFINYYRRKSKNGGENLTLVSFIFPGMVVFAVSSLFFCLVALSSSSIISFLFEPKYEALVIEYVNTESDSGDKSITTVVEFKDSHNQTIKKPLNYSTSDPVEIGKTIKIGYEDGDRSVTNLSFGTQKLIIFIVALFLFILSLAMVWIVLYSLGKDYSIIFKIGGGFLMYLVFPAAMLFFIGAMSWVIWEYFQGRRDDMPIWALGVCSLFVTLLIPAFLGYMKLLFSKEKSIKISKKRISK